MRARTLAVAALLVTTAGCYHATIETGRPMSSTVIERPWAHSFIAGLVPPATLETASECPNGVARVETQLSFLNMVANIVTGSIYSPMHLIVTCAAGSMEEAAATEVDMQDADALSAALEEAAVRSWDTGQPVYLRAID